MRSLGRSGRTIVAFWMVATAIAFSPLRVFALCVAPDGHWTLESAHAGPTCDTHRLRHRDDAADAHTPEIDPHPCRDVTAVSPARCDARQGASLAAAGTAAAIPLPTAGGLRDRRRGSLPLARGTSSASSLLRSVVIIA